MVQTPPPPEKHCNKMKTNLLHFLVEDVLDDLAQSLVQGLCLFELLLLLLVLWQLKTLLRDGDERFAVILLQLLHGILVDRIDHVEHLKAPVLDPLNEGRVLDSLLCLARDEVDLFLGVLHA